MRICTNLFTEEFLETYHNSVRTVNETKTSIHFPEEEAIYLVMFGNLIDGSQNAVWHLALEGKIPHNYENRSNYFTRPCVF